MKWRVTYAPYFGGVMGTAAGLLAGVASHSTVLGIIVFIIVGALAWFACKKFEDLVYKGADKLEDAAQNAINRRIEESRPPGQQSLAEKYAGTSGMAGPGKVQSNEWMCPACKKIHPRYESTCTCGYTFEEYLAFEKSKKEEEKKRREGQERERIEAQKKMEAEMQEAERFLSNYENLNLSQTELLVIRILSPEDARYKLSEMVGLLPRSADINGFSRAVVSLNEAHLLEKDEEGRYYLALRPDEEDEIQDDSEKECLQEGEEKAQITETESKGIESVIPTSGVMAESNNIYAAEPVNVYTEIRKYKELLDEGIITPEEFAQKKEELLGIKKS